MRQCGDTRSTSTQDDVLRSNSWSCVQGPEWMWVVLRGCSLTSEANWGDDVIGRVCSQVLCGNGMAGRTKGAEFSGELISTGTQGHILWLAWTETKAEGDAGEQDVVTTREVNCAEGVCQSVPALIGAWRQDFTWTGNKWLGHRCVKVDVW